MSTKNDFSSEYETLLWRKSIAENYLHNLKEAAKREGLENLPVMIEKIKTAEKEVDRATRLFEKLEQNPLIYSNKP